MKIGRKNHSSAVTLLFSFAVSHRRQGLAGSSSQAQMLLMFISRSLFHRSCFINFTPPDKRAHKGRIKAVCPGFNHKNKGFLLADLAAFAASSAFLALSTA